jgi:hypothetical protein
MAVQTHLNGWNINVVKNKELAHGELTDVWILVFNEIQEPGSRVPPNQIQFPMHLDARNELIRQLTGGLVLGGEIPQ